jgi:hypothetical protein
VEGTEVGGKKKQILLNKEKIKLRTDGKTIAKANYSALLKVTLDGNCQTKFTIVLDSSGLGHTFSAANGKERDMIVQTIRSFNILIQRGKNVQPEHLLALSYNIRHWNEIQYDSRPSISVRTNSISISNNGICTPSSPLASRSSIISNPTNTPMKQGSMSSVTKPKEMLVDDIFSKPSTPAPENKKVEIDADGFTVAKDRGFASYDAKKEDDGFTSDEDAIDEEPKPAIQMKINEQGRAIASGQQVRNSVIAIGLGGQLDQKALKAARKADKEKRKKDKKDKKLKKSSLTTSTETVAAASEEQVQTPTESSSNGFGINMFNSPPSNSSPSPKSAKTDDDPPLSRKPSLSRPLTLAANIVDMIVCETIHARIVGGNIVEYAVWGELIVGKQNNKNYTFK